LQVAGYMGVEDFLLNGYKERYRMNGDDVEE
jgi:hypothetical protein